MKKLLLCFIFIQTGLNCYSQINFEKGYYYNNDNVKKDCFIRNIDWLNNPTEIEYKLTQNGEVKTEKLNSVSEFGVSGTVFKRFSVKIDKSTNILNDLGYDRNPEYVEETLFLKQIVKGNLNLYRYVDGNLTTFFYNGKDKEITQLVYKKYLKSKSTIAESNIYKQELLNYLVCEDITSRDINQLRYSQRDLSKLFIKYNTCKGVTYGNTYEKKRENVFNANLRGGINFNNFKIPSRSSTNPSPYEFDFGTVLGFQIGVETEFILPFNN